MSSVVYTAACHLPAQMGEFGSLAEIAAANALDWNDGTLDTSCAAARHLSPPAIVTGEIEDSVEIAAATLRVTWRGMASLFQQGSAVGVSCVMGRRTCLATCIFCVLRFSIRRMPLPPRGVGTLEFFRRRQPSCVSGFVAYPGASQRSRCSGCQSGMVYREASIQEKMTRCRHDVSKGDSSIRSAQRQRQRAADYD